MRLRDLLLEGRVPAISKQQAIDHGLFGPVFHGTSEENRALIHDEGFKIHGVDDITNRNGFLGTFNKAASEYGNTGIPAPIHLLGFGVYFTPSRSSGRRYNVMSTKGLVEYYLNVPRLETINYASPNTMMRWWMKNGYDFNMGGPAGPHVPEHPGVLKERYRATMHLTETLKEKFDAVHYKGQTMGHNLDDPQICVFEPEGKVFRIDPALSTGMDIGGKVYHTQFRKNEGDPRYTYTTDPQTGVTRVGRADNPNITLHYIPPPTMKGTIVNKRKIEPQFWEYHPGVNATSPYMFEVKWAKGGTNHNYTAPELKPV